MAVKKKVVKKLKARRKPPVLPPAPPAPWASLSLAEATAVKRGGIAVNPFDTSAFRSPPKGVLAPGAKTLAMDSQIIEINAWSSAQVYNNAFFNGQTWLGFTYLAELAQRPEYRRPAEIIATEATRKWITLKSKNNDESKADRIAELEAELVRLDVQGCFRKMSEYDSLMGRMHLFLDMGDSDDDAELRSNIGNGRDAASQAKFGTTKGFLKSLRPIEPVWCYPLQYNSNNPLSDAWYNPQLWSVMAKQAHVSRVLTFVAREVPDLLKPSYQFGGLSLSQMMKPYVDNWLRTRQSVSNLIWSFSTMVLSTNMETLQQPGGAGIQQRLAIFANLRTNEGVMVLNKEAEELTNISVPLGSLDALQSQSQEHMCAVSGIPVVKLFGIQPMGLNASSAGEITVFNDMIAAYQEMFFDKHLTTVIAWAMRNIWGAVDEDIVHEWEPVAELTEAELATVNKTKADTDAVLTGAGIIAPEEARNRLANDPQSGYGDALNDGEEDADGTELEPDVEAGMGEEFPDMRRDANTPRRDEDRGGRGVRLSERRTVDV